MSTKPRTFIFSFCILLLAMGFFANAQDGMSKPTEASQPIGIYRAVDLERDGRLIDADTAYGEVLATIASTNGTESMAIRDFLLLGRARTRYRDGMPKSALAALEDVSNDKSGEKTYLTILSYAKDGRLDEAATMANAFISERITPTNELPRFTPEIRFWSAAFDYNSGEYAKSEYKFRRFAEYHPNHPSASRALLMAGASSFALGQFGDAASTFANLAKTRPDDPLVSRARFLQAKALMNVARFEDAVLVLDDLLERFPDVPFSANAYILRGDALRASSGHANRLHEAELSYAFPLVKSELPRECATECLRKLAKCQAELKKFKDAKETISRLAKTDSAEGERLLAELSPYFKTSNDSHDLHTTGQNE